MPSYAPLQVVYATDEDILVRAPGDFALLCPPSQRYAQGADGVAAGWTLSAPSVADWTVLGLSAGMVAQLGTPKVTAAGAQQYQPKDMLVVDAISGGSLTLRRPGMASGMGQPPTAAAGERYLIATLAPQVEDACYELNRRFGVDPAIPGRTPAQFYDVREVNQAAVLTVLKRQYVAMARMAGEGKDDLWEKAAQAKEELQEVLDRLALHWTAATGWGVTQPTAPTTQFSTRIAR